MVGMGQKQVFVGGEVISKRGILQVTHPIKRGKICDWDRMEKIWHHTFYNELRVAPEDQPLIMTDKPLTDKTDREKMAEIMFETFNVPLFHVSVDSVLSLYASGRTSGLVVNSGHSLTNAVPIHEGLVLRDAVGEMDVGALDVVNRMQQLLGERGYSFFTSAEKEIVRDIKERFCYVAMDFEAELEVSKTSSHIEKNWENPFCGQVITVGAARFRCPELLFEGGNEYEALPMMIARSISRCDRSLRDGLLGNVVLSGGNTMFEGMAERIQKDLHSMTRHKYAVDGYLRAYSSKVLYEDVLNVTYDYCGVVLKEAVGLETIKVVAPPERKYSTWIGGSILAGLEGFRECCISKKEYDEVGPSVVRTIQTEV